MRERKLHLTLMDGSQQTMCGIPVERALLADLGDITGPQIVTCKSCCRAWDYHFGDDD